MHRPANVDDERQLSEIVEALDVISERVPLFWPVHPRTRARLAGASIKISERIHLLDPLGYVEFLALQASSFVVLTDSGGIQEETTVLGVPCLTLRENTRASCHLIECGTNRLRREPARQRFFKPGAKRSPRRKKAPCLPCGMDKREGAASLSYETISCRRERTRPGDARRPQS